jgi:hypothetical protein
MLVISNNLGQKAKVPATMFEWSTGLFQTLVKEWDGKDRVKLFCIFTGWEYEKIMASKSPELDEMIMKITQHAFTNQLALDTIPVPYSFKIKGIEVPIPKKIEAMTIAQNMHVRNALMACKDIRELISYCLAIYLQPYIDGEFDYEKALTFEEEIKEKPIIETYALGFFLLMRLRNAGKSGWPDLLRLIRLSRWNVNLLL